jgi:phage baseplate assembly protein gpV
VELDAEGQLVNFTAPGGMTIDAPTVHFTGAVSVDETVTAQDDITSTGGDVVATGISLINHVHPGVTSGGATTGPAE